MRTNHSWIVTAVVGLAGIAFFGGCGSKREASPPLSRTAPGTEKIVDKPGDLSHEPESAAETASESANDVKPKSADDSWSELMNDVRSKSAHEAVPESANNNGPPSAGETEPEPANDTGPKAPSTTGAKSADDIELKTPSPPMPKSANNIRPKILYKKSAPPKLSAKSVKAPKPTAPAPAMIEEENNPMRSAAEPPPQSNPMRPENSLSDKMPSGTPAYSIMEDRQESERPSESNALSTAESELQTGKKLFMRETEGEADIEPGAADDSLKALPAQADNLQGDYTVVKVFYGTDRAPLNALEPKQPVYMPWLMRTIFVAAATLFLSILGFRYYPSRLIRGLAYSGVFATGILAALTIYARFQAPLPVDLIKISPSASISYGPDRGKLELGACEVSIPKSHDVGELESPSVLRLEFREDPRRHVVLLGVQSEPAERFFAHLRECVGRSSQKSAFVFVHGYNTTFNDAARRTAQIAYDLKFDGAPIFYSWPSQGKLLQYAVDETNVAWSTPHLLQFLTDVAEQSGAERIHLIAHSMGNRALTSALRDLSLLHKSPKPMFNEVVLTAPDIDADVFKNEIAPALVKTARRVTLYASSKDEALVLSKKVHGYPRAGDSGDQLVVVPGVDTVDVSAVDTSLLGHNYYGDNSSVLADLFELLQASKPADQRQWLHAEQLGLLKYWVFQQ